MKKIFIYYSLTGNGDLIANYLKDNGYDIRKVETSEQLPRNYFLRILTGGYKAMINYKDKLINFNSDINNYSEVVIGSPIWNDRLSSPINTVLNELDFVNKKISFILYSGSGRSTNALEVIKDVYHDADIIELKEPIKNKEELQKLDYIIKKVR